MSVKILIEDTIVLAHGTLILRDNQTARIQIALPLDAPNKTELIKLTLTWSNREQKETDVKWQASGKGTVAFDFTGWQGIGTTLKEPALFGYDKDGNPLFLNVAHRQMGVLNVVHFVVTQQLPQ